MEDDRADAAEDRYADWLAACDEVLAGRSTRLPSDLPPSDIAGRLEADLDCLKLLRRGKPCRASLPAQRGPMIGRFQAVRELGRGGFGVVFLAVDSLLGREVALKVPHAELLGSPEALERFRTEARAAAGLNHPNIVSVFETGEAGPVLYLVSTYYPAGNLAQWIRAQTTPVPGEVAARLVAALADGVQHAHDHGVIHRDLKPANVLLDRNPADNRAAAIPVPKIADFGLAKFVGSGHTVSGAMLGTPNYMAPEQAGGRKEAVGPAADVYSLGTILYEMLTGRPPFVADDPVVTLAQVRDHDPVPPGRLRAGVARDLETVCLKCMEKEPTRRYPSAVALASDLRRYLGGQTVTARPVGPAGRVRRWARRNPAVAALSSLLIVALVGGLVGVSWEWRRAEGLAASNARERDDARAARDRAERHYRQAQAAVDRLTDLGDGLTKSPPTEPVGRAVLDQAMTFYQDLLADPSDDPRTRWQVAQACYRVGSICSRLGRTPQAEEAFDRAIRQMTELAKENPASTDYRHWLGRCHRSLANLFRDTNRPSEACAEYARSAEVLRPTVAEYPGREDYLIALANTLMNHAVVVHSTLQNLDDAEAKDREAIRLQEAALALNPKSSAARLELALTLDELSRLLLARGQMAESEAVCRRSLEDLRCLAREIPADPQPRWYLARSNGRLAKIHHAYGREAEADAAFAEATRLQATVVADLPTAPAVRIELVDLLTSWGTVLWDADRLEDAERVAADAAAHVDTLQRAAAGKDAHRVRAFKTRMLLGGILTSAGRFADARHELTTATELCPDESRAANALAWAYATDPEARPDDRTKAVEIARRALRLAPENANYLNTLGACLARTGDPAAVASLERAAALRPAEDLFDHLFLVPAHLRSNNREAAQRHFDRAAFLASQSTRGHRETRRLLVEFAASLGDTTKTATAR